MVRFRGKGETIVSELDCREMRNGVGISSGEENTTLSRRIHQVVKEAGNIPL